MSAGCFPETPLASLRVGQRFQLVLESTGRVIRGELVRVSLCSATVKLAGNGSRSFVTTDRLTGEQKTVTVPEPDRLEHWALSSPVVPD